MAQAPQPPHKPAQHQPPPPPKPGDKNDKLHQQGDFKEGHAPLRDPTEGKPPAVAGGFVQPYADDRFPIDPKLGRRPTIGVKGEPIEDGERDPDTIAEEQRRRSEEMQAVGVERWMYDHDTRSAEEKGPFVAASDRLPAEAHPDAQFQSAQDPKRVEHHESRK